MAVSGNKFLFLETGLDSNIKEQIQGTFRFQFKNVDSRLKYLGF